MEEYKSDLDELLNSNFISFKKLKDKKILITGATGLIGSALVSFLLLANEKYDLNCSIVALIRNIKKAERIFRDCKNNPALTFLVSNITKPIDTSERIDYIVHTASDTSSRHFIDSPIEVINTTLTGTKNILDLATKKTPLKTIFLSTMEVYGHPTTDEKISENHPTNLQTNDIRNSYPISKRMAENLCFCYAKSYDLNINVLRLTQTIGPGVSYDDNRVFVDFARCIIEGRDIILHTKGDTKRSYLYTVDAISAILTVLFSNQKNEIYNVANEDTYCSILDMAKTVAQLGSRTKVIVKEDDISKYGYAPTLHMNLDTTKIKSLGWKPSTNLITMFSRLIADLGNKKDV